MPLAQGLHDSFDSWLGVCEAVLAQPLKTQGDPVDIMKQLKETKVEIGRCEECDIYLNVIFNCADGFEYASFSVY